MSTGAKKIWESKTFWVNIVAVGAAVATAFGVDLGLDEEGQAKVVAIIMGAVNIGLRLITDKPVSV